MGHVFFCPLYYILHMSDRSGRAAKAIRMKEEVYHEARVAAVVSRKSLGQWIEEAIAEKLQREAVPSLVGSKGGRRAQVGELEKKENHT